jgi:hypothetical protein
MARQNREIVPMIQKRFIAAIVLLAGLIHPVWAQDSAALSPAVQTWQDFVSSSEDLGALSAAERTLRLAQLGSALRDDPAGVSDDLERSIGGGRALRAYLQAMLAEGELSQVVEQFHAVMHGGETQGSLADVLNVSEQQDGSVWFPQAEQAGFFAGSLAAVLDGQDSAGILSWLGGQDGFPEASQSIATRFDIAAPATGDTAAEWFLAAFTDAGSGVAVPAAQWFEQGFTKGYR